MIDTRKMTRNPLAYATRFLGMPQSYAAKRLRISASQVSLIAAQRTIKPTHRHLAYVLLEEQLADVRRHPFPPTYRPLRTTLLRIGRDILKDR